MQTKVKLYLLLLTTALAFTACSSGAGDAVLSATVPEVDKTREAKTLTAFFGLDNNLPPRSVLLYKKAPGKDGMPVVFSQEVDPATLNGADFEVTTANGTVFTVEHATLRPANEAFELRTVLLIGNYGNHPDNPPVTVKIIGDLMSRSGQNYKGQSVPVVPLPAGPILSYAEYFTIDDDYPYVAEGNGCDCPKEGTAMVVRAVWAGGVRATDGNELGPNQVNSFEVTMVQGTDTTVVTPYQLADINDNDNNIDLCLKQAGTPIQLTVQANVAIDPNDDQNPKTTVAVISRW